MEEKTYTLTEKELFDLLESVINVTAFGAYFNAMTKYNADKEITDVLVESYTNAVVSVEELTPINKEIHEAFRAYGIEKGKAE